MYLKQFLLLAGMLAVMAGPAAAQPWAESMFNERSHDFGTVARGSKAEYRFRFVNKYKETVQVASVSSSCGCATVVGPKVPIKSRESSEILVLLNTVSFLGSKSPVITVTFDKPFFAQVQLRCSVFFRSDVVIEPGSVNFGRVSAGQPAERMIRILYAGAADWDIVDVRTANAHLEAELPTVKRYGGNVEFQMLVRLKGDAPIGYLKDTLSIITNDAANARIPLDVEGKVESEVVVNPSPLVFGTLKPGDKVTTKVTVRGKRPFRITRVECDDCIEVQTTDAAKTYHLLPVTFVANKTGHVEAKILFETDLGKGVVSELPAYADIVDGPRE